MKIIKYDNEARFTDIVNIMEVNRQKYRPNDPIVDYDDLKMLINVHWPDTVMERDVLCAVDENGITIGVVGLFKSEARKKWNAIMSVIPEYETFNLWNEMITEILNLAKEQNAPDINFRSSKESKILNDVLATRNIIPDHYMYSLQLKNLDNLPEVTVPKGITIKTSSKIPDKNQYIAVMNEAYSNVEEWTPDTEENIAEFENMNKKNFDDIYYLAYKGKTLVGACNVSDTPKENSNRFINGLGVRSKYQKKGIGGALMFTALQDFKAKGRKDVMFNLSGKDASDIKLPVKFGFKEIPSQTTMIYSIKPDNI